MDPKELKAKIKKSGVYQWEIAKYLGIGETTLSRKLRGDIDPDLGDRILEAVEILKARKENETKKATL